MIDMRGPVLEAIGAYRPAIEALFEEVMEYALEKIDDEELCVGSRSSNECRQLGDLVVYHAMFEMFSLWFDWQFDY